MSSRALPSVRSSLSGLVLMAGSGAYALAQGALGVSFNATPLFIGVIALVAGLVGTRRHLVPVGLALAGWGVGVLLATEVDVLGERTTALHVVGFGAGLGLVRLVAPAEERGSWLTSASLAVLVSGLVFLVAFDMDRLGKWQAWTAAIAVWGLWELRPSPERADTRQGDP